MSKQRPTSDHLSLLHALGFFYLRHGQNRRGLILMLLAARTAPDDPEVLKTLAYAFLANDTPDRALEIVEELQLMESDAGKSAVLLLLRSRALLQLGEREQARQCFRRFLKVRARAA